MQGDTLSMEWGAMLVELRSLVTPRASAADTGGGPDSGSAGAGASQPRSGGSGSGHVERGGRRLSITWGSIKQRVDTRRLLTSATSNTRGRAPPAPGLGAGGSATGPYTPPAGSEPRPAHWSATTDSLPLRSGRSAEQRSVRRALGRDAAAVPAAAHSCAQAAQVPCAAPGESPTGAPPGAAGEAVRSASGDAGSVAVPQDGAAAEAAEATPGGAAATPPSRFPVAPTTSAAALAWLPGHGPAASARNPPAAAAAGAPQHRPLSNGQDLTSGVTDRPGAAVEPPGAGPRSTQPAGLSGDQRTRDQSATAGEALTQPAAPGGAGTSSRPHSRGRGRGHGHGSEAAVGQSNFDFNWPALCGRETGGAAAASAAAAAAAGAVLPPGAFSGDASEEPRAAATGGGGSRTGAAAMGSAVGPGPSPLAKGAGNSRSGSGGGRGAGRRGSPWSRLRALLCAGLSVLE
ncbi:hypothetical protein GPECTOR_7g962 [Gonium pectorale]|uniref:Uncharacterized protein n=1 Tax=Gonium pectorale TaxID=33097 RepID=A0A150GUX9_GONPE|nr:hypothetical protein GPECTOR_7g962 [Gonium pectorale]|eukprot:KXZ53512.1 hypothetical protein GPECTOR_7g962 [Gonium pectorale]